MRYLTFVSTAATVCVLTAGVTLPAGAASTAHVKSDSSTTWAGYVAFPPKGHTIKNVGVVFRVPKVKCSGSVGAPTKGKLYPGWHASFWAGIDGWSPTSNITSGAVQQAGVIAFCRTRKSAAIYRAFYEMYPADPRLEAAVRAGDRVSVDVSVAGKIYSFSVENLTTRKTLLSAVATCARRTKCGNAMAEVITEAPGGGPDSGRGLADTGTVRYTYAAAGLSRQPPYVDATPLGAFAALTKLTMSPAGHPRIVRPGRFRMGPNGLTDFDT